jgi:quercetin dioxygenase-like cupin family protein
MRRLFLTIAVLLLTGFRGAAQDPVKLSPAEVKVEVENDLVRVLRVKRAPHAKAPVHEHPAAVVIALTDVRVKNHLADGSVQDVTRKKGQAVFNPPRKHAEENISDQPLEVIVIELKAGPGKPLPLPLDAVKVDPKHNVVEIENERVRVIRILREPHAKMPLHEHGRYVSVALTDVGSRTTFPDGTTRENRRKAGETGWRDPVKHSIENLGDQRMEEIQVEIK